MANFVQLYKSTDTNAPTLTGQVGSIITLLNKCLVDGYSTASVTSITRSSTTATYTLASSNATLVTGNYLTITGATGGDASLYNGTYMITVLTGTTGTYTMTGTPGGSATGTLLYAKAGLQWTRPFSAGTNAQTYRSADTGSNQFYLQVIDNGGMTGGAKEAGFYGAEVMSADQVVTSGQFPTVAQFANGLGLRKSTTADATTRAWALIGDDRTFYLVPTTGDSAATANNSMGFGYFISFKPGDGFNTFVAGNTSFSNAANAAYVSGLNAALSFSASPVGQGFAFARLYSQTGGAVIGGLTGQTGTTATYQTIGANAWITYPNPADSGLYVIQALLQDATSSARGRLPGWFMPQHQTPLSNYDQSTGITGLSGVTLTTLTVTYNGVLGQVAVDTFGPWT